MALTAVLVDRARILRRVPSQVKVEGRTIVAPDLKGAWFRIRMDVQADSKSKEPTEGGMPRVVRQPRFICGVKDSEGRALDLKATDRLEVRLSGESWTNVYEFTGDPAPLRKRRRVIGYEGTLKRVEEHPMDPTGSQAGRTG